MRPVAARAVASGVPDWPEPMMRAEKDFLGGAILVVGFVVVKWRVVVVRRWIAVFILGGLGWCMGEVWVAGRGGGRVGFVYC